MSLPGAAVRFRRTFRSKYGRIPDGKSTYRIKLAIPAASSTTPVSFAERQSGDPTPLCVLCHKMADLE